MSQLRLHVLVLLTRLLQRDPELGHELLIAILVLILGELERRYDVVGVLYAVLERPVPKQHQSQLLLHANRAGLRVFSLPLHELEQVIHRLLLLISSSLVLLARPVLFVLQGIP